MVRDIDTEGPWAYKLKVANASTPQEEGPASLYNASLGGHFIEGCRPEASEHLNDGLGACNNAPMRAVVDSQCEAGWLLGRVTSCV
jgi:hypothetical protein